MQYFHLLSINFTHHPLHTSLSHEEEGRIFFWQYLKLSFILFALKIWLGFFPFFFKVNCHMLFLGILLQILWRTLKISQVKRQMFNFPTPIIAQEAIDWEIMQHRFLCKVGNCMVSFTTKWNLHKHAKDNHNLIVCWLTNLGAPPLEEGAHYFKTTLPWMHGF